MELHVLGVGGAGYDVQIQQLSSKVMILLPVPTLVSTLLLARFANRVQALVRLQLSIMNSFSTPFHAHLAAEPQALLALSRFATPEKSFDLVQIERKQGMKAMTKEFAVNVLSVFLNNMESVEFEGRRWRNHLGGRRMPVAEGRWKFLAVDGEGRLKRLVA